MLPGMPIPVEPSVEARPVGAHRRAGRAAPGGWSSLAWRVLLLNSAVLIAAGLALALSPATVSSPVTPGELAILLGGLAVTLIANVVLVRRAFGPLARLTRLMNEVDPLSPGRRISVGPGASDVRALAHAFNGMLERVETERRDSARRAVLAQESERRRIALELHDELGQTLTGVLLQIDAAGRDSGAPALEDAREAARTSLEEVRRIARDLRPDTLVELGITSALNALATRFARQTGVPVTRRLAAELPRLTEEAELVIYRVAQESLTNVARHAEATSVLLALETNGKTVTLIVEDDGRGLEAAAAPEGRGLTGMRERALLVSGRIAFARAPGGGLAGRLVVPVAGAGR